MNKNGKNGARLHRKHRRANRLCHVKGRGCRDGLEYKYYICDWKDRMKRKEKRHFKMHWVDILADIEEERLAEEEAEREALFREVYGPCMYDYNTYEDYMDAVFEWGYRRGFEEGYKSGYEMWLREVGA